MLRADGAPVLFGFKRESAAPLLDMQAPAGASMVLSAPDRSYLPDGRTFLKRKFAMTGNGKTFLLGAGIDVSDYIDEIDDRVAFPEMFVLSLLSNALMERGLAGLQLHRRADGVYRTSLLSPPLTHDRGREQHPAVLAGGRTGGGG